MSEYQAHKELKAGAANKRYAPRQRATDSGNPVLRNAFRVLVVAVVAAAVLNFAGVI